MNDELKRTVTEQHTLNVVLQDDLESVTTRKIDYPVAGLSFGGISAAFGSFISSSNNSGYNLLRNSNTGQPIVRVKSAEYVDIVTTKTPVE